jgi:hypothetical protein
MQMRVQNLYRYIVLSHQQFICAHHLEYPDDDFFWPKEKAPMKSHAHNRIAVLANLQIPLTNFYMNLAMKHFEHCLLLRPNVWCRDNYLRLLEKTGQHDEMTQLISLKGFKRTFTLSETNIREICYCFGLLTPGLRNYVKAKWNDLYFAIKQFVQNEKEWLVTFVHPFCDEDFPISVTEEILAFTYPL